MLRNERYPVAWLHQDVAVRIGGTVRLGTDLEGRQEGSLHVAVGEAPFERPLLATEREVQALSAGAAHIVEIPRIGRGRDELNVVLVDSVKDVRTPVQLLIGEVAARAHLDGARDHLLKARITRKVVR